MTDKHLTGVIELKDDKDADGDFTIRFSTFDVVDLDRDIVLASAVEGGLKLPLLQSHRWGDLAIGGGEVINDGKTAVLDGGFITASTWGKDAHETAKALHARGIPQEASWGFKILEKRDPTPAEAKLGAEQVIEKTQPFEVSTVLRGAGVDTGLIDVKTSDRSDQFKEHAEQALAACDALLQRAATIADLRAKDGRDVPRRETLEDVLKRLQATAEAFELLLTDPDATPDVDVLRDLARFQAIQFQGASSG